MERFSDLGKIEAIRRLFENTGFQNSVFFECGRGSSLTTASRLFIEGTDFNLVYFPLRHLGYKCALSTTGPLMARMAKPKGMDVVIGVSSKLDFREVSELWGGIVAAAKEFGYKNLSLDLTPSQNGLTISISASGERSALTSGRLPKPKTKDLLCVSGRLGAAYMGLRILERGLEKFNSGQTPELEKHKMLVGAYLKPELDAGIIDHLEDAELYPSSAYFLQSGLGDALKRIVRDTGLGVKVYADHIPFEGNTFALGKELDIDPVSAAMNGGDDSVLLLVIPILQAEKFRREMPGFTVIGHLAQSDAGAVLVTPDGLEHPVSAPGWGYPSGSSPD